MFRRDGGLVPVLDRGIKIIDYSFWIPMISFYIDPDKCSGCGMCRKNCPADAIDGAKKTIHIIDQEKCTNCITCFEVCPAKFGAVTKLSGEPVPEAIPEEKRVIAKKKN